MSKLTLIFLLVSASAWGQTNDANGNIGIGGGALNDVIYGGVENIGIGVSAAAFNHGQGNAVIGSYAMNDEINSDGGAGNYNTVMGYLAMQMPYGSYNTVIGNQAYQHGGGTYNTAIGNYALGVTSGSYNIGLGTNAGRRLTSGTHNIDIDNDGAAGESYTTRIGTNQKAVYVSGIAATKLTGANVVVVSSSGLMGTMSVDSIAALQTTVTAQAAQIKSLQAAVAALQAKVH